MRRRSSPGPSLFLRAPLLLMYRSCTAHVPPAAGDGVPVNPAIAHRLLLLLAELGSAEAMADAGFHAALGVEPVAPNSRDQLFRCETGGRQPRSGSRRAAVHACRRFGGLKRTSLSRRRLAGAGCVTGREEHCLCRWARQQKQRDGEGLHDRQQGRGCVSATTAHGWPCCWQADKWEGIQ